MANYTIVSGDSIDILTQMVAEGRQVDSVVTDPPYHLTQVSRNGSPRINDPETPFGRTKLGSKGFMGKTWDGGDIAHRAEFWQLVYQVLKPGGHLLSFAGSRTYHRMAVAIEDAGFDIRDQIMWLYGSGFPKSLDVSKAIDKAAGVENVVGTIPDRWTGKGNTLNFSTDRPQSHCKITAPATEAAKQWEGWGSALKPAHEPIVVARKPLSEPNIAANVLKHGTGALNVDGCRIEGKMDGVWGTSNKTVSRERKFNGSPEMGDYRSAPHAAGRFPANVILDEDAAATLDAQTGILTSGANPQRRKADKFRNTFQAFEGQKECIVHRGADSGGASRFFYCAKASKKERRGSNHSTVKPVSLMRYLCRLVTPPGGTVLDPFAGSGTTGEAALLEGFYPVLIEREPEYIADIERRLRESLQEQESKQADVSSKNRSLPFFEPICEEGERIPA